MEKQGNNWVIIVVVAALLAFGVFVWPTPYQYEAVTHTNSYTGHSSQVVYRINRFTGERTMAPIRRPGP
jgi:hypothetical protein